MSGHSETVGTIYIDYSELDRNIGMLLGLEKSLTEDSGPQDAPSAELINSSMGQMFRATNETFRALKELKGQLLEVVSKTRESLEKTGLDFVKVEEIAIQSYQSMARAPQFIKPIK